MISNKNLNVVQIGESKLQEFGSACPTVFYQSIKRKIITVKEGKKERGMVPMEQCDLGSMSTRTIIPNDVLNHELAAVPTSIFDEKNGELRISTSKSILKRKHQV